MFMNAAEEVVGERPRPEWSEAAFLRHLTDIERIRGVVKYASKSDVYTALGERMTTHEIAELCEGRPWKVQFPKRVLSRRYEMYIEELMYIDDDARVADRLRIAAEAMMMIPQTCLIHITANVAESPMFERLIQDRVMSDDGDFVARMSQPGVYCPSLTEKILELERVEMLCVHISTYGGVPFGYESAVFGGMDEEPIMKAMDRAGWWMNLRASWDNHRDRIRRRREDPSVKPFGKMFYEKVLSWPWRFRGGEWHSQIAEDIGYLVSMKEDGAITESQLDKKVDEICARGSTHRQGKYLEYFHSRSRRVLNNNFVDAVVVGAGNLKRKRCNDAH